MKLINYKYHIVKYINQKADLTFYKLESQEASCQITVTGENSPQRNVGLTSFKLKQQFLKGWVLDNYSPYDFFGELSRERSESAVKAIRTANKVVDDLKEIKKIIEENPDLIQVDEYQYPPK